MERFTLFYNDYSICSIMVRYTIAVACFPHDEQVPMGQQLIDIQHGGQLSEHYLCEVNPKGTVPVLKSSNPEAREPPLTESLDITHLLAKHYPSLSPADLTDQINKLLAELHNINYFSLTYTTKPQRAVDMENAVHKALAANDVSVRYRKALEFKLEVIRATRAPALTKEQVTVQESKALAFLSKIEELLAQQRPDGKSPNPDEHIWIFDTPHPTALDAHVVPFIARLLDVGRKDMLPDLKMVLSYGEGAFRTEAWNEVMQGRKTVYGTYL